MQAVEGVQVGALVLRHDLAVPLRVEAVDHDAVEAREGADLGGELVAELRDRAGLGQPSDGGPCCAVRDDLPGTADRLELDHDAITGVVHDEIDCRAAEQARPGHADPLGDEQVLVGDRLAHRSRGLAADHVVQHLAADVGDRAAEHLGDVRRDDLDAFGEVERQQEAVGLDRAGDVDRLTVARREARGLVRGGVVRQGERHGNPSREWSAWVLNR